MTSEVRTTVDEKLVTQMAEQPAEEIVSEEVNDVSQNKPEENKVSDETSYELPEVENKEEVTKDTATDDFGNEVAPKKTYTEEEVNELMRQRFNRTKKEEFVKPAQQPSHENANEDWEQQLEGFVENTFKKITVKEQQRAQQAREQAMQAEFQDKMLTGMDKYKDFKDVVGKMPISDPMLLATRQMKDPAAFIYAASKTQSKELMRIAEIADPFYQAAEMGRLEERMRKVRSGTNSPKPVSSVKGDIENRSNTRGSVDDLIRKDALKKLSNRRY